MRRIWLLLILASIGLIIALAGLFWYTTDNAKATPQSHASVAQHVISLGLLKPAQGERPPRASQAATTANPWAIALDETHGVAWVAEPGCEPTPTCPSTFPGIIGEYSLFDGTLIQIFKEPAGYSSPLFVAVDTTGNVWFTEPNSDALGELIVAGATWNQWHFGKGSIPFNLLLDKQGRVWLTQWGSNTIGCFNPQTQRLTQTPIPTAQSHPYGITIDQKGTIWFTENREDLGQIASFVPTASGVVHITEHLVTTREPHLIAVDRAGNIWYTEAFSGFIGEYNPVNGARREIAVTADICPIVTSCFETHISGIAIDRTGKVWFDDSLRARVGYIVEATGKVVVTSLKQKDAHPHDGLAVDSLNSLWFTEQNGFALVRWPAGTLK